MYVSTHMCTYIVFFFKAHVSSFLGFGFFGMFVSFFCYKSYYVAQASLRLVVLSKLVLNLQFSCFNLLCAGDVPLAVFNLYVELKGNLNLVPVVILKPVFMTGRSVGPYSMKSML